MVAGVAVVLAILSPRFPSLRGLPSTASVTASWSGHGWRWTAGLMLTAFVIYVWAALSVFSGRPLFIDEIAQVFQARIFADGALTRVAGPYPEFFTTPLVLEREGRFFAQFPPGGPAMLALGALARTEWLTGPVFGAISVGLFAALARRIEPRPGVSLAATCLFAFAPFAVFMSGSHMNHVTALTWIMAGCLGLARVSGSQGRAAGWGAIAGLGFGVAATIRPVDAFAFGLPAGLWLLAVAVRRGRWAPLLAAAAAMAIPAAAQLWINYRLTGAPFLFAYVANWGEHQGLGFHQAPWGEPHTPVRGIELLNLYFVRLQSYLFELPIPSLVPAITALALTRTLGAFDRYFFASATLLVALYFAYWHDGFYLGPRFFFPLLPFLALWAARSLPVIRDKLDEWGGWRAAFLHRALGHAAVVGVLITLTSGVPARAQEYRTALRTMRWDPDRAAAENGIRDAVVLVRESWGAQLIGRMWAAQVSRSDVERMYRKVDACALETALDSIEALGLRGEDAAGMLRPLLKDSARVVSSPHTPDRSTRLLPGSVYSQECLQRLREDQRGFTLFTPLQLARRDDVLYARDLHAHDSLLLLRFPDRDPYLLRPATSEEGAPPRFEPLSRDSLLAAWRAGR